MEPSTGSESTTKSPDLTSDSSPVEVEPPSWKTVEVVLDVIFDFLPIRDLKNVRLTCRFWSKAAARSLTVRTRVHLAHEYQFDSSIHEWDAGLRVKRLSMYGCDSVRRLPQPQFSQVVHLKVTEFTPSHGTCLLEHQIPYFLPNLKSLEMRKLNRRPRSPWEYEIKSCNCCKCKCPDETCSTCVKVEQLDLEKLVMEVGHVWNDFSWDLLLKSGKLRILELIQHSRPEQNQRDFCIESSTHFAHVLDMFYTYISQVPRLEQVTLSFDLLTSTVSEAAVKLLNKLNLKRISLELKLDTVECWETCPFPLLQGLIARLSSDSIQALDTIQVEETRSSSLTREKLILPVLKLLKRYGFFRKTAWDIRIGGYHKFRFRKTSRDFVFQLPYSYYLSPGPESLSSLIKSFFVEQGLISNNYNYAFLYISKTRYESPGIYVQPIPTVGKRRIKYRYSKTFTQAEVLINCDIVKLDILDTKVVGEWEPHFNCPRCDCIPKFICDLPGFLKDACIVKNYPTYKESGAAWTFCTVPREVLAKWIDRKESEIAAMTDLLPACSPFCRSQPKSVAC